MRDEGHEWTTQQIIRMEAKIRRVYEDALASANDKYAEFTRKFLIKDEIHRAELKSGKITKVDYRDWLKGQVFQRERLEAQIADLAKTMTNANRLAMDIINDATPGAFAYNANWAAFAIEKAGNADMGFGLYDAATVKRLIREDPTLLPPSRVEIPKDLQWNTKKIAAQINQGIILGEDLATIAKRFRSVTDANANMSLTHARTAMTGAQNAGRIDTYRRAEEMGIKLEKEWLATLDSRTRSTHGMLDGQHVPVDGMFRVENYEIRYPGDPTAHPAMVYNCRCTLISRLLDYPAQNAKRRDESPDRKPIKDMTFKEWRGMKGEESRPTEGLKSSQERAKIKIEQNRAWLQRGYDTAVKNGDISALTSFEHYMDVAYRVEMELVGAITSDNIQINGYKTHFLDRIIGSYEKKREPVSIESAKYALEHGEIRKNRPTRGKPSNVYITSHCKVSINPETGTLIQATPKERGTE